MKRLLFIIALLCLGCVIACKKTETAESSNVNSAPASAAAGSSGNTATAAAVQTNANQPNEATPQVKSPLPPPTGHVNDYANVIDNATKLRLEKTLRNLRERARIEFGLVTVKTTGKETIFDYSLATARGWGIGGQNGIDGLLLMVAVDDRKWRVQVTRGLEADLPEDVLTELSGPMVEAFRKASYSEGLTNYVAAIIERLKEKRGFKLDESLAPSPTKPARS